jgi:GTPase SAR1 family protein
LSDGPRKSGAITDLDTAGQEKYFAQGIFADRNADIGIIFSLCEVSTFDNVRKCIETLVNIASRDTFLYIVRNKLDLIEQFSGDASAVQEWAKTHFLLILFTSALTGDGVQPLIAE